MPRLPRLQFPGAFYHIYDRGNRKERIFRKADDYARFESFLLAAVERSDVRLFDWALIPNHYHLSIQTPHPNLAEFMQRLGTRYAKYFNWRYTEVGHLFQGRYGYRLVSKEDYFLELVRYIELNPYRTKKAKLAELGEWKWSSLRYYLGKENPPPLISSTINEVLQHFDANPENARQKFSQFLAEGLKNKNWEDFYKPENDIVGPPAFIEKIKNSQPDFLRKPVLVQPFKNVEEFLDWVCKRFQLNLADLRAKSQNRELARWRQAIFSVGRGVYQFSIVAMARALHREGPAISLALSRMYLGQIRTAEMEALEQAVSAVRGVDLLSLAPAVTEMSQRRSN